MKSFFHRLWYGETDGLTSAALIIGASSLLSRLVGLLRDQALAATFGAGSLLDSYYAAFRLPDMIYNLIVLGALSAGFIPVYTELFEKDGEHKANALACRVLWTVGCVLIGLSLILFFVLPSIAPFVFHGFVPDQIQLTVTLSRIMAFSPVLLGLSAVMGGVLQARRRFVAFSLAPVFYNVGILFGIYFLVPAYGIQGVAVGVVLGAFAHFIVQASVGRSLGAMHWCRPSFVDKAVQKIAVLTFPRMVGLGLSQLNLVIMTSIASAMASGSISVFQFANNLQSLPLSLFGISYALAAFPSLTQAAARDDLSGFVDVLIASIRRILFLILPSMVLCLLLRAQIVRLVLGQGAFDWNATIRTANVFALFIFSLPFQACIAVLVRSFYALQKTWTPVYIGFGAEVLNVFLAWTWRDQLGVMGLALAFSIASAIQCLVLIWSLRSMLNRPIFSPAFFTFFFQLCASVLMASGLAFFVRQWIGTVYPLHTSLQVFLQAGSTTTAFALVLLLVFSWFHLPEYVGFLRTLSRMWKRFRPGSEGVDETVKLG